MVEQPDVGRRVRARRAPDRGLVDVDDLVDLVEAADALVRTRPLLRPVEAVGHRLEQHLVHERRLARPRNAGDGAEDAERNLDVDLAQVVLGGARHLDVPARPPALLRQRDLLGSREVLPRERFLGAHHAPRRALGHEPAAVLAGAGAEVHEMVRGQHGALVVLDDYHGVAEITQPVERGDQPLVVALVQADRGLVQDVQDAHQRRPDLSGQPDPLRLAAGEGCRGALQRQVADADVVEERQPLVDLAQDEPRDLALGARQLELLEPLDRTPRRHVRELVDPQTTDLDCE